MSKTRSRLATEIKQRKPFRSASQEATIGLLKTADAVRRKLGIVTGAEDVTAQQYNVLRILRGAGDAGLPTLEIGQRMIEQAPGITRLLDRLEAKALVRRERCAHDRRQVLCYITAGGLKLLAKLDAPIDAADEAVMAGLTKLETKTLIALLEKVRAEQGE